MISNKIRRVASKFNKSYAFKYALNDEQVNRGIKVRPLIQDVPTRWGSTRESCSSFLDHKDDVDGNNKYKNIMAVNNALQRAKLKKDELSQLLFTPADMMKVDSLNKFLTSFDIYSTTLGGNKYVTGSIVLPVMKSIQADLVVSDEDPSYIATLKQSILDDIQPRISKNLNYQLLVRATALDPRFKNLKVLSSKVERQEIFKSIEDEMRHLTETDLAKENEKEMEDSAAKKRKLGLEFYESDSEEENDFDEVKTEIQLYKKEPMLDKECDPLEWWKKRSERYPLLSKMVRKYLCVPATSVESERTFSSLGLLLTKRRLCMTGENVNKQLFLKDKLNKQI